jgi:transposase
MSILSLRPWQRRQLRRQLEQTPDARTWRRTLALLEVDRGRSITEVAQLLRVSRRSVYNWIDAYTETCHPAARADAPRSGRPGIWTEPMQAALRQLMATKPDQLGYFAVNWTVPLLGEQLEHFTGQRPCDDTIRDQLGRMGYVWKRPRYVLEPDTELEKKTPHPPRNPAPAAPERAAGRG